MKKILFINPFGIGDVLFTTPVILAVKDRYPDAFVGYWCNERVAGIFNSDPLINRVFALSRGDLKKLGVWLGFKRLRGLVRQIKQEKFDTAFDFSLDHRYGFIAKLCGIKKRIGYNYKNRGRFLTDKSDLEGYSGKHIVEYYLDLLKFVDIRPQSGNLHLTVSADAAKKAARILEESGIKEGDLVVGIAPGGGASWGLDAFLKHWPAEKFAQLADRLADELKAKILLLGDKSEELIADRVKSLMRHKPVDFTGRTNLEELIALTDRLSLLVCNDGGPLHIAASLNKKTISFFGPVDPRVYGPYPPDRSRHSVLKGDAECMPCYRNFRLTSCARDKECLEKITVDTAFKEASRLLP